MSELELVRLHEDGEHLVLAGPDGARFTLPIDDALRAAVRRDRTQLEQLRAQAPGVLPVREIQSQLRAGHSARDVAERAGIPIEQVHRFEGPVLAEQEYVVEQVRKSPVGHENDSPSLGELVSERLAARGVEPEDVEWSAARPHGGTWTVTALFLVGDRVRSARWSYDPQTRALHALEDEARWLAGPPPEEEPARGVRGAIFDHAVEVGPSAPTPLHAFDDDAPGTDVRGAGSVPARDATTSMLDDLSQRRGVRQPRDEDSSIFEGFGPPQAFDLGDRPAQRADLDVEDEPVGAKVLSMSHANRRESRTTHEDGARSAHPAGTGDGQDRAPDTGTDRVTRPEGEDSHSSGTDAQGAPPADAPVTEPRRTGRKTRASVPSWDEIVFGAKPEH